VELSQVVDDIVSALTAVDARGIAFKQFQPGVGPYGEPHLVREVARYLNTLPPYRESARTMRTPDLLIPGEWALEFKIARPFGNNGQEAENWP